jgi:hypothetical protein
MQLRTKATLITLAVAVPAMLLGPVLFPPSADISPTPVQMALLLPVLALEALALGLGVAFLRYGWPLVCRVVGENRRLVLATYVSSAWLLVNWWLHDNLHISNGLDINALIAIDWAFHTTLILASAVVCHAFLESLRHGRLRLDQPGSGPGSNLGVVDRVDRKPARNRARVGAR